MRSMVKFSFIDKCTIFNLEPRKRFSNETLKYNKPCFVSEMNHRAYRSSYADQDHFLRQCKSFGFDAISRSEPIVTQTHKDGTLRKFTSLTEIIVLEENKEVSLLYQWQQYELNVLVSLT